MGQYQSKDFVVYTAPGTDIANQPMIGTVSECQTACANNIECVGFSRAKNIDANSRAQCWLKKTHNNRVNYDPSYQTFVKSGTERFGNVAETSKKYHHNYSLYLILVLILVLIIAYVNRDKLRKLVNL